jgi:hypothetical protein
MAGWDDDNEGGGEWDRAEDKAKPITAHEVRVRFEASQKATRSLTMSYWKACAFVNGDQWLLANRDDTRLTRRQPRSEREVLAVNNRLLPASVTIMAKLHRRPHSFEVSPLTGDDSAVSGARLGQAILADCQKRQNWARIRTAGDWMAWKGGTALLCVEWDAEAGGSIAYDATPGEGTSGPVEAGDVCVTALSTAQAFCEPGTADIERGPWWIKAVVLPPKQVRKMFDLDEDPEADGKNHVKYDPATWRDDAQQQADMTMVLTLFERPCKGNPGQVVTVVGDKVVARTGWPFPFTDRLNVTPVTCVPVDNRWIGQTVLWQAMSLQYLLNRCESALAEHQDAMGKAKLMIPEGSVSADYEHSDDPYESMYVNGGTGMDKPAYLSPPQMPNWVQQSPDHYYRAIDDVLGTHAISRGDAPSGVESGVALSFLGEQDDTPVGELARVSADAWAQVATNVLELYADKVAETREASVEQTKGPPQVMEWSGEMLAGQTRATLNPDSVAPRGRLAQAQLAMNFLDRGVYGNIGEKETTLRFLRAAELPDAQSILEAVDHHEAKAHREVAKMFAGKACIPKDFDDHATMIRVANEARLSARYDEADDEIAALFDDYCLAHQKLDEEAMVKQKARALVDPAMAVAAQAHEPALAGDPQALVDMQAEQEAVTHRGANIGGGDAPAAPDLAPSNQPGIPTMANTGERA